MINYKCYFSVELFIVPPIQTICLSEMLLMRGHNIHFYANLPPPPKKPRKLSLYLSLISSNLYEGVRPKPTGKEKPYDGKVLKGD